MFMLHFFSFVGILPFLDGSQIIYSKTRLPRETYVSLECSLSLCCPFPTLPVKLPDSQTLSACKERSRACGTAGWGQCGASPASWTAARTHGHSVKEQGLSFPFLKNETETGLKLMIYKCLEKIFKHFINVKLSLY